MCETTDSESGLEKQRQALGAIVTSGDGMQIATAESPMRLAMNQIQQDQLLLAGLAKKVGLMYEKTEWAKKDKTNTQQGFKYASADQMYDDIRKAMAEVGLAILPILARPEVERTANEAKGGRVDTRVFLPIMLRLIDSETGYSFDVPGYGESTDTGDKGVSKAITAALKYTLRSLFLIPTGDDPDAGTAKEGDKAAPAASSGNKGKKAEQPATEIELSPEQARSKTIANEIGINIDIGKKINHAAKQLGKAGYLLICEAYDAGHRSAAEVLIFIEAKAEEAWLESIGMDAKKLSDFKAACESRELSHAEFAAEARNAGCKTIEQIYAYLESGETPSEEQKAANPTESVRSAAEAAPGSSPSTEQPSSAIEENPFVNEEQLIASYQWKDGELNRFKSICKAKNLEYLKVMERGVTKKFTTAFQLIAWAKDGAK